MPRLRRNQAMHVATSRRHYKDKVYETHLLRRSYRDVDGKVRNQTLANLSHLPDQTLELVRRSLKGEQMVAAPDAVSIVRSLPHGHVAAVAAAARKLGLPALLGPACVQRDIAYALIIARVCRPGSKLATCRWWQDTTLAADLGLTEVGTDQVYAAMDWLLGRQPTIEKKLAARHLSEGEAVLYDLSGSWVEGRHCELAAHGDCRDGRRGKAQVCYGLVANLEGWPVAVNAFTGDTSDPTTFADTVKLVTGRLGIREAIMIGDRGMITAARIAELAKRPGMHWITALRAPTLKKLAADGTIQPTLFDQTDLAEVTHPDFPDERLVVCPNPALAEERVRKRRELLAATDTELDKVVAAVAAGRLKDPGKIGVRVGRIINRYKMAKHYTLDIDHGHLTYQHNTDSIEEEAALDGIYVVRTSLPDLPAQKVVTHYKALSGVEALFRSMKTVDLDVRPIRHRKADRVRAHLLICMLAAYLVRARHTQHPATTLTDPQPPLRPRSRSQPSTTMPGDPESQFRGSIAQPARTPVNASPTPSRAPPHDSGPPRVATPSV